MLQQEKPKAWRNDAVAKVTGQAKYTDDLKFHNMLHAVPVYSDAVHAKINAIDATAAESYPGVVKVLTARDVMGNQYFGEVHHDQTLFAIDKVLYHGDVVAMVIAETREIAIAASKLVKIDLTELPPLLDPEKALENSQLVHEAKRTNVVAHHKIRTGDIEKGFANSDFIIEQDFTTQFIEHAYIEPESAISFLRHDGVIEIHGSAAHPYRARQYAATALGVKLTEVEVMTPMLGGSFGGKDDTASIICARTALAAKLLGRPVKMTYDREWSFLESNKRHPYKVYYKMGFSKAGKIQAIKCKIVADGGAYASMTPYVTWRSTVQCCGPYEVPNVYTDTYGVYTNNIYAGAMRGFGSPQINFAIEQLVEMAAEKLGISAIDFRRRNLVKQNSITITGQKLDQHTVSSHEVLDKVLAAIDYENKVKKCTYGKSNEDELYGIGIATSYRGMSLGAEGSDFSTAIINGQVDGSILLQVGNNENGQGMESAMVLILAEHLGVDKARIRYDRFSTSRVPDGGANVASRVTLMAGGAVVNAANNLKQHMAEVLAGELACTPNEVTFKNDCLYGKDEKKFLTWYEASRLMFRKQHHPYAFGTFQAPKVSWDEETGRGNAYFTWVYQCQAVELSVNRKTGKVKILNAVAAHDVGKAINPPMLLGQFFGGMAQGIGYALMEDFVVKEGKVVTHNFNNYKIPRATDLPDMTGIIVENADPLSPSKAKGIGEPTLELMAPAIANAVYNATGKRYFKLPIKITI